MKEPKIARVRPELLGSIAAEAVPPSGTLDVVVVVEHQQGSKIKGTDLWSGLGGVTQYGVAWFDGLKASKPIALFDHQKDAHALAALLTGEEGELWKIKQARKERIARIEAEEAAMETSSTPSGGSRVPKPKRRGAGSSRRSRSSEKPSGSTPLRLRVEEQKG